METPNLLIIDDEPNILETLSDIFKEEGFKVHATTTGGKALEIIQKEPINVALIDIRLPDIDGMELLHQIKKERPNVIGIIITGNATLQSAIGALKDNADGYFQKPIKIEDMIFKINNLLEKQALEKELKESEQRFRTIADQSLMGILIVQEDTIVYVNNAFCDLVGSPQDDLLHGKFEDLLDLIDPADRRVFLDQKKVLDAKSKESHSLNTYQIYGFNSKLHWVDAYARSIEMKEGIGLYIAMVDVTQKIVAEKKLKDLNRDLEAKIKERTQELEAANRAKSIFLANVSHELRTPMNSIIGFSEALLKGYVGDITDEQEEYISDIYDSGQHLLSLINEILDLSKIEAGKLELHASQVLLVDLMEQCRKLFKEKTLKHQIHLDITIADGLELFTADERKIKQVLFNMLDNAIKYTQDGGKVGIMVTHLGDEIQFKVWDTGIGIKKKDQERLFQPFERIEVSGMKSRHGTGLGLHYSKKLVELHGGRIWVESAGIYKGSAFFFTIPQPLQTHVSSSKTLESS